MKLPKDSEFVAVLEWDELLYREALCWVDETRRAAFLADREIRSEDWRVKIYVLESPLQLPEMLKKIAWSAVFKQLAVIGDEALKGELERIHMAAGLLLSEAADYWVSPLNNARSNQFLYRRGMELKGVFEGIPALIVGAGPSLEQNGHWIRSFQNRGLIFAGGTALNTIDVEPHFGGSIDPQAPYRQFKRHPFFEVPFCYQARMNAENFSLIHGEKLLFPDSSCEAINWLYEEQSFDAGWTVANFMTAAAVHMGCSPIIFVGMDFCYTAGKKYSRVEGDLSSGCVRFGDVMTQKDWLMAARWTENVARGRCFINATEGGILDLPQESLSAVLNRCPIRMGLRQQVHVEVQRIPLKTNASRWREWELSLARCQKNMDELEGEIVYDKLLFPLWQIWRPIFEREEGVDSNSKLELHRKIFFQKVLEDHGSLILPERGALLR